MPGISVVTIISMEGGHCKVAWGSKNPRSFKKDRFHGLRMRPTGLPACRGEAGAGPRTSITSEATKNDLTS